MANLKVILNNKISVPYKFILRLKDTILVYFEITFSKIKEHANQSSSQLDGNEKLNSAPSKGEKMLNQHTCSIYK